MSTTTTFMGLIIPDVNVTPGPDWAVEINDALETIDEHDHSTGSGRKITPSGFNVNADMSFNDYRIYDADSVQLVGLGADVSNTRSVYVKNADLYFKDGAGNNVRITNGGALDISAVGGIGGDYSSSGASVIYSTINSKYTFYTPTGDAASIIIGGIDIDPSGSGEISGNISFTGVLTLEQDVSILQDLSVTGDSALTGSISVTGVSNLKGIVYMGSSGTPATNVKIYRSGTSKLSFAKGNDSQTEGNLSTNLAELSFRMEQYASGSLPSPTSQTGRMVYDTTFNKVRVSDGTKYVSDDEISVTSAENLTAGDLVEFYKYSDGTFKAHKVPASETYTTIPTTVLTPLLAHTLNYVIPDPKNDQLICITKDNATFKFYVELVKLYIDTPVVVGTSTQIYQGEADTIWDVTSYNSDASGFFFVANSPVSYQLKMKICYVSIVGTTISVSTVHTPSVDLAASNNVRYMGADVIKSNVTNEFRIYAFYWQQNVSAESGITGYVAYTYNTSTTTFTSAVSTLQTYTGTTGQGRLFFIGKCRDGNGHNNAIAFTYGNLVSTEITQFLTIIPYNATAATSLKTLTVGSYTNTSSTTTFSNVAPVHFDPISRKYYVSAFRTNAGSIAFATLYTVEGSLNANSSPYVSGTQTMTYASSFCNYSSSPFARSSGMTDLKAGLAFANPYICVNASFADNLPNSLASNGGFYFKGLLVNSCGSSGPSGFYNILKSPRKYDGICLETVTAGSVCNVGVRQSLITLPSSSGSPGDIAYYTNGAISNTPSNYPIGRFVKSNSIILN